MTATVLDLELITDLDFAHTPVCELNGCLDGPGPATHVLRVRPPCGCLWVALLCDGCTEKYMERWGDTAVEWLCVGAARHSFPAPLSRWSSLEPMA